MSIHAKRVEPIEASGIRRAFELAAQVDDPIDLSIGQAHYEAPEAAREAAAQAILDGFNRYTMTQGIPELIEAVTDYARDSWNVDAEDAFITNGASAGLVLTFLTLIDRGDRVLLPDPYFVIYLHLAHLCEAEVTFYPLYPDFQLDAAELAELVTPDVKAIVVNSPANPTGATFDADHVRDLVAMCREHEVHIISDEIYADFTYDGEHVSPLHFTDDAILISGLAKTWGVAGWRLGYVLGPKRFLEKMKTLQQFTFVCPPAPLQLGAIKALQADMTAELDAYGHKRDRVYDGIAGLYDCPKPTGAFYAFPKVPAQFRDDEEFCAAAREQRLLLVPGRGFSTRTDHFRISFAAEDDVLDEGVAVLRRLAGAD